VRCERWEWDGAKTRRIIKGPLEVELRFGTSLGADEGAVGGG
jgi:hypothetical protein